MDQIERVQAFTDLISTQNMSNVIILDDVKESRKQAIIHSTRMRKQRLIGMMLFVISLVVLAITKDWTIIVFLSPFYGMMMFYPKYIMKFNEKR